MPYEVWADPGFERELANRSEGDRTWIRSSFVALAEHPLEHPRTVRLKGTRYPGSFRLRVGRYRILGIVLGVPKLILLTTMFLKKRESDYEPAAERHERRLRSQGPPLDEFLRTARRR